MGSIKEKIKNLNRTAKYMLFGMIAVVLIAVVLLVVFSGSGDVTIDVETSLKEIIASSELTTAKYTYNSIAEIQDGDTIKYHVAYKGTVSAGFDFEDVEIKSNDNVIRIVIPELEILSVDVDTDMDYIFVKDKYDSEDTYSEAYNACCEDLEEKAKTNVTLLATAKESAKDTITALIKPLEGQLNEGQSFEIVFETEEGSEQ